MKNLLLFAGFALLFILQSCNGQYEFSLDNLSTDTKTEPEVAIPLVNASITLEKLLNDDTHNYIFVDEDQFMTLKYDFDVVEIPALDFFGGEYSGTLDQIIYQVPNQVYDLNIKRRLNYTEFYIANPSVKLVLTNFWDIPVKFRFKDFYYYKEVNSVGIPVTGTFVQDWHTIDRPVAPAFYAVTEHAMNTGNSNIDEVISAMPDHLTFAAELETTPGVPYQVGASTTDSVRLKVEIPLQLRITDLVLADTFNIKLGQDLGKDTSKIESLQLNLIFENGFPLDIEGQFYFADENGKITDSLRSEKIVIQSAVVSEGIAISSTKSTEIIKIEGDKKTTFVNSNYVIAMLRFNTSGNESSQTVKFFSSNKFGLKIGALAKLKL